MDTMEPTPDPVPDRPYDPPPPVFGCGYVLAVIAATVVAMLAASIGLVLIVRTAS